MTHARVKKVMHDHVQEVNFTTIATLVGDTLYQPQFDTRTHHLLP
jgi:hypothetical protein